jgi:hypothetical protein
VLPSSINAGTVVLNDPAAVVPANLSYDPDQGTITLTPRVLMNVNTVYSFSANGLLATDSSTIPPISTSFTTESLLAINASAPDLPLGTILSAQVPSIIAADGRFGAVLRPYGVTPVFASSADGITTLVTIVATDHNYFIVSDMDHASTVGTMTAPGLAPVTLTDRTTAEALLFLSPLVFTTNPEDAIAAMNMIHALDETDALEAVLAEVRLSGGSINDPSVLPPYEAALTALVAELPSPSPNAASSTVASMSVTPYSNSSSACVAPIPCYSNKNYVNYDVWQDGNDWVVSPNTSGSNVLQALRSVDWSIELAQTNPEITGIASPNVAYQIDPSTRQMMYTHATTLDQYLQVSHWTDIVDQYVTNSILNETDDGSEVRVPANVNASYILRGYSGGFASDPLNTRAFIYSPAYSVDPFSGPTHDRVAFAQNIVSAVGNLVSDYAPDGFVSTWSQDVFKTVDDDLISHGSGSGLSTADIFGIVKDATHTSLDDVVQTNVSSSLWGSLVDELQQAADDAWGTVTSVANFGVVVQRVAEMTLDATPMESALLIVGPPPTYPTNVKLTATQASIGVHGTYQIGLVDGTGATVSPSIVSKWITANQNVATVNGSGLVTGVGPGQATISITALTSASFIPLSFTATVSNLQPAKITIAPSSINLSVGQSKTLTAAVYDTNGKLIPGTSIGWSSTGSVSLTTDSTGAAITANAVGAATVTASVGSISAKATVNITPVGSYSINCNPSTINVTAGKTGSFTLTATSNGTFANTVALAQIAIGSTIPGTTGSWSSNGILLSPGGQGSSKYSFSTSASSPAGNYTLNIKTSSGSLAPVTTSVTVIVAAAGGNPSYSVSMIGSGQSVTAGNSAPFTLTATSVGGFSGTVSLAQPNPGIAGVGGYWSSPSIVVPNGGQNSSNLTITTSTNTPPGPYSIPLQTSSASLSVPTSASLTVTAAGGGGGVTGPTASFTMSYQGQVAYGPNGTLNLTAPSSGNIVVALLSTSTPGSAPIATSYWTSSGNLICATSTTSCPFTLTNAAHNLDVTLNVTDSKGNTSTAIAHVVVNVQQATGPTASFTMSYQGQVAYAPNGTLNLTAPSSGNIVVTLLSTSTVGSFPIASSYWTSSGNLICATSTTNCPFTLTNAAHNLDVTLTVTDTHNMTSQAVGHVVVTVPDTLTFTKLTPTNVTTAVVGYQATMTAVGTNFLNVNKIYWTWSGTIPSNNTWVPGTSNWSQKVQINSDTSMTLYPVVSLNTDKPGTYNWTVTLTDNTGVPKVQDFTVTFQ